MAEVNANLGKSLTLHSGGSWAGYLPSFYEGHECADDLSGIAYQVKETGNAAADPVEDAVATFDYTPNLQPLGYSGRVVPTSGTGNGLYNSDLAFKDNLIIAGTYAGFRIIDATDKSNPTEIINYTGCAVGQGDVIVYGNLLIRSWDSPSNSMCDGKATGSGFEGIHIFDISNPAQPVMIRQLRMASSGNEVPPGATTAPTGCGSHTATLVPDPARGYLYVYNGGSSGTCNGIDIVRIKIGLTAESPASDVAFLRRVSHGRSGSSCHDNNVIMGVGGGTVGYAMCAGGNGLAMYAFDMAKPADAVGSPAVPATENSPAIPAVPGGVENPQLLWSKSMGISTGHSGSFTYDGKSLIFGHEPGGGSQAQCQASSSTLNKTLFFLDPLTGDTKGTMIHPRPQTSRENCTWHNFNVVPTKGGYFATSGSYQSGISILDFTDITNIKEIAYADPAPLSPTSLILGGDWSTYWHNGYIYESDIRRGVITWKLNGNDKLDRVNTFAQSNPQTQLVSYAPDNELPTIDVTSPTTGNIVKGSTVPATATCADNVAVESCTPATPNLDTSSIGEKSITFTAMDTAGNKATKTVTYVVNATDAQTSAGGTVAATLGLTLGGPAQFAAFIPGVAQEYSANTSANVISTAGDAALTVADPSSENTGKLVNGTFSLPAAVTASASSAGGTSAAGGAVGGSASPTSLLTYSAPVSNDAVTITFKQAIGSTDALRTGTYSKTFTFTLSTTTP